MGITYKIDTGAGIVFTVGRGSITYDEFVNHRRKITSDPDYKKDLFHLVDYREAAIERNTDQARRVAQERPFAEVAIVAGENSFGFARMVEGWSEDGFIKVFHNMAPAREWLGLPPEEE